MRPAFSDSYDRADQLPGQPIPIRPFVAAAGEYPIDALSPKLRAAVLAIMDKVQIPAAIAAQAALAAASLAVQPFIDVQLPTGEIVPACLFLVSVAASGDRKSSTDKLATRGVRRREAELREEYRRAHDAHQIDAAAYGAAKKKALQGKNRHDMADQVRALGPEPVPPPQPLLISDEGTLQGLQKLFAEAMPSLGLFSDEGGMWLGGYAMAAENRAQTGAALSKLWDGAPIKRVRGTDVVTFLPGRRLSLHLMVQPRIAKQLFGDADLKDQGLLSRILMVQPTSLKGERFWRDPDLKSDDELERFEARVHGLLRADLPMDLDTRELKPTPLPMSAEARQLWIGWHDAVEQEQKLGGAFDDITGFASKLPEHAARLAGIMAYFEDRNVKEISGRALSLGIKLSKYYVEEALRVIGIGNADEDADNAATLIAWIREKKHPVIATRYLARNVIPKSIRPAQTLARALEILVEHGHLKPADKVTMMIDGEEKTFRAGFTVIPDDDA